MPSGGGEGGRGGEGGGGGRGGERREGGGGEAMGKAVLAQGSTTSFPSRRIRE